MGSGDGQSDFLEIVKERPVRAALMAIYALVAALITPVVGTASWAVALALRSVIIAMWLALAFAAQLERAGLSSPSLRSLWCISSSTAPMPNGHFLRRPRN